MCGIAGLFSKSSETEESLGAHLSAMLAQLADRGPGQRRRGALPRSGAVRARSRSRSSREQPDYPWNRLEGELAESFGSVERARADRHARAVHGRGRRHTGPALAAPTTHPELRVMSIGEHIEIYKEMGDPREFIKDFGLESDLGEPRARPHPDGDREPGHDRALAPVLDRARPLPGPQRLALESQPAARRAAPRGDRVPDRQRLRGRGRLPDLAALRGRRPRDGAERLPRPTSTASTPSRSGPPTGSRCCATRSPASRP